jgi:hypothetical protein
VRSTRSWRGRRALESGSPVTATVRLPCGRRLDRVQYVAGAPLNEGDDDGVGAGERSVHELQMRVGRVQAVHADALQLLRQVAGGQTRRAHADGDHARTRGDAPGDLLQRREVDQPRRLFDRARLVEGDLETMSDSESGRGSAALRRCPNARGRRRCATAPAPAACAVPETRRSRALWRSARPRPGRRRWSASRLDGRVDDGIRIVQHDRGDPDSAGRRRGTAVRIVSMTSPSMSPPGLRQSPTLHEIMLHI